MEKMSESYGAWRLELIKITVPDKPWLIGDVGTSDFIMSEWQKQTIPITVISLLWCCVKTVREPNSTEFPKRE